MTDRILIERELLEQVASEFEHDNDRYMLGRELRKVLDALRQPEGDYKPDRNKAFDACPDAGCDWGAFWQGWKACHADHLRAIAELREECGRLRGECARLESKYERDVWGLNNEGDPIGGDHPSGFANDLLRVTAERDTLRQQLVERDGALDHIAKVCRNSRTSTRRLRWIEQRAQWAIDGKPYDNKAFDLPKDATASSEKFKAQRDKLAGLLREAINWDTSDELLERIDAALAEVNK